MKAKHSSHSSELKQFTSDPLWYSIRAVVMIFLGGLTAIMCIIEPDVHILGERFSWIPVIGTVIFLLGVLRCIDAYMFKSLQGYLINMQAGVLDVIVGVFVLFSIDGEPSDLVLLIACYLLIQGVFRTLLLSAVIIENPRINKVTGVISFVLGFLIWLGLPTTEPWFLAISLSLDVSFRGWALLMLSSAIKKERIMEE